MTRKFTAVGIALTFFAGACAEVTSPLPESEPATTTEEASPLAIDIEVASRMLDRGEDATRAKAMLEAALRSELISSKERSDAILALSRAHELLGDTEAAIVVLEEAIAQQGENRDWQGRDFYRRLRKLLTGSEESSGPRIDPDTEVPPLTSVLASYFPRDKDGTLRITVFIAGGDHMTRERIGLMNFRGAVRAEREAECPLCDEDLNISRSISSGNWMIIPQSQDQFISGMTLFYYDLEQNRIPSRYEKHLPMSVADIEAELQQGNSFVIAKERPGAPPALLVAAPRTAMLPALERQMAQLDALPTDIVRFDVSAKLQKNEIQAIVREALFEGAKECYESVLETRPQAQGKVVYTFSVDDAGSVTIDAMDVDAAIDEGDFSTCMSSLADNLRFPATGDSTTIRYPLAFTPSSI